MPTSPSCDSTTNSTDFTAASISTPGAFPPSLAAERRPIVAWGESSSPRKSHRSRSRAATLWVGAREGHGPHRSQGFHPWQPSVATPWLHASAFADERRRRREGMLKMPNVPDAKVCGASIRVSDPQELKRITPRARHLECLSRPSMGSADTATRAGRARPSRADLACRPEPPETRHPASQLNRATRLRSSRRRRTL